MPAKPDSACSADLRGQTCSHSAWLTFSRVPVSASWYCPTLPLLAAQVYHLPASYSYVWFHTPCRSGDVGLITPTNGYDDQLTLRRGRVTRTRLATRLLLLHRQKNLPGQLSYWLRHFRGTYVCDLFGLGIAHVVRSWRYDPGFLCRSAWPADCFKPGAANKKLPNHRCWLALQNTAASWIARGAPVWTPCACAARWDLPC